MCCFPCVPTTFNFFLFKRYSFSTACSASEPASHYSIPCQCSLSNLLSLFLDPIQVQTESMSILTHTHTYIYNITKPHDVRALHEKVAVTCKQEALHLSLLICSHPHQTIVCIYLANYLELVITGVIWMWHNSPGTSSHSSHNARQHASGFRVTVDMSLAAQFMETSSQFVDCQLGLGSDQPILVMAMNWKLMTKVLAKHSLQS
jgi:hypothetical protein